MNDGQFVYPEKWMTYLLGRWPRTELGVPKKGKIKYLQHGGRLLIVAGQGGIIFKGSWT